MAVAPVSGGQHDLRQAGEDGCTQGIHTVANDGYPLAGQVIRLVPASRVHGFSSKVQQACDIRKLRRVELAHSRHEVARSIC
jgi:DNA-binding winged helix-turn-helix (wHTH) protein